MNAPIIGQARRASKTSRKVRRGGELGAECAGSEHAGDQLEVVAMLDPVAIGVVSAENERGRVDRPTAAEIFKDGGQPIGVECLTPDAAGRRLERLPGALLGEKAEQDDAQEDILGGKVTCLGRIDDVLDEVLRDSVGGTEGVAELVLAQDRVVRPRPVGSARRRSKMRWRSAAKRQ